MTSPAAWPVVPVWLVVACFSTGFAASVTTVRAAEKQLSANTTLTHDFGTEDSGGVARHSFMITNPTPQPIVILDERMSCGCIGLERPVDRIMPGESRSLDLALALDGKFGQISQNATFKLRHPQYKTLQLKLEGLVRGTWVEPATVDLGTINQAEQPEKEFTVYACAQPGLEILTLTAPGGEVSLRKIPVEINQDGKNQQTVVLGRYAAKWDASKPAHGLRRTKLVARLSDGKELPIALTAFVSGASNLQPRRIVFGSVRHGQTTTRKGNATLKLEVGEGQRIDVQSDSSQVTGKVVRTETIKSSGIVTVTYDIEYAATDLSVTGKIEGDVRFAIDKSVLFSLTYFVVVTK